MPILWGSPYKGVVKNYTVFREIHNRSFRDCIEKVGHPSHVFQKSDCKCENATICVLRRSSNNLIALVPWFIGGAKLGFTADHTMDKR